MQLLTYAKTFDLIIYNNCPSWTSAVKVRKNNFRLDKNKKLLGQQIYGWTKIKIHDFIEIKIKILIFLNACHPIKNGLEILYDLNKTNFLTFSRKYTDLNFAWIFL